MAEKASMERWIITVLLSALSAVLWYLLLDTRADLSTLRNSIINNGSRITTIETKLDNAVEDIKDLKHKH